MKLKAFLMLGLGLLCGTSGAFAGEYVDPPQQGMPPTVARGMHACDDGHVMTGVRLDRNQYLCASVYLGGNPDDAKRRIVDVGTQRVVSGLQMHACPAGMVVKGYDDSRNLLLCETAAIDEGTVTADVYTQREDMHACPVGKVMKGLHAARNVLACVNLGRF